MKQTARTRLFVIQAGALTLILEDEDSLGVRRTLRLQSEERIACFNGDGNEYDYRIVESTRRGMVLSLLESRVNPCDRLPPLTVWIASTKGNSKDRIVRDLPPLGATRIVFYRAVRSVCLPREDHQPRLEKIAVEACRQCGRSTIPSVEFTDHSLPTLIEQNQIHPDHTFLFWEKASPGVAPPRLDLVQPIHLLFGPEGGFSEEEMGLLQERHFPVLSLGDRILRTELAVTTGVAMIQFQRGLLR